MAKVPIKEVMHLRDYMAGLGSWREKSATQRPEQDT